MKTTLILLGMLGAMGLSAFGQTVTPPEHIEKSFNAKASFVEEVVWSYNESENRWEIDYVKDEKECSMAFSRMGDWLETETDMEVKALPKEVRARINTDFGNYVIKEVEYVETPEGSFYELEGETKDQGQEKQYEIKISTGGEVLSKMEDN